MRVRYFAYGSNMASARMTERVPSARVISVGYLSDARVVFNKRGKDGSAKANLEVCSGERAWGVIYELDADDLVLLDRIEGGYQRQRTIIVTPDGGRLRAEVYRSDRLIADPVPFDWYKELVLAGAREHGLPEEHIQLLAKVASRPTK